VTHRRYSGWLVHHHDVGIGVADDRLRAADRSFAGGHFGGTLAGLDLHTMPALEAPARIGARLSCQTHAAVCKQTTGLRP
jgi:hypothetical protein